MAFVDKVHEGVRQVLVHACRIMHRNEVKILPRAGMGACLLGVTPFSTYQELGLVLAYVHVFYMLIGTDMQSVAFGTVLSGLFCVAMYIVCKSHKNCKGMLYEGACAVFCCADMLITGTLYTAVCEKYLVSTGLISLGILIAFYMDGLQRPGMQEMMIKDAGILILGALKGMNVNKAQKIVPISVCVVIIANIVYRAVATMKGCRNNNESESESNSSKKSAKKATRSARQTTKNDKADTKSRKATNESMSSDAIGSNTTSEQNTSDSAKDGAKKQKRKTQRRV